MAVYVVFIYLFKYLNLINLKYLKALIKYFGQYLKAIC